MRYCFLVIIAFVLVCFSTLNAQITAVTENGDEVTLYSDGTWKYLNIDTDDNNDISVNTKKYKKEKDASFLLKSNKVDAGFWLDPKMWSFKKSSMNEQVEFEISLREGDVYAMVIAERAKVRLKTYRDAVIMAMKQKAPDLKVVSEEYRTVNGLEVLQIEFDATVQGIEFTYYAYLYSGADYSLQYFTYTYASLYDDYRAVCEELLNGLVDLGDKK